MVATCMMKTATVHVDADKSFQVALIEGSEPSALLQGVASRASSLLPPQQAPIKAPSEFFFTVGGRDDAVVPLSASLPDKMDLYLYLVDDKIQKTSSNENTSADIDEDNTAKPSVFRKALEKLLLIEPSQKHQSRHPHLHSEQDKLVSIYHFNRLGTDLANERTMLAWIRTMLAAVRTVFSYLKYGELKPSL